MKIINEVNEMRQIVKKMKREDLLVGFVPTMGYLHDGHLSLVKAAKVDNDIIIVSIFVNPTQFGPNEDLDTYPRDLEKDQSLLENLDVDYLFFPKVEQIYPNGYGTYVNVESGLTNKLCGKSRPGHFKGVTTIVSKLFNIVNPDKAYFGHKDAQQVSVINRMVKDLNFDIEIIAVPIVRENDGLAMSSRNVNLSEKERQDALTLSKSLNKAKDLILLDNIKKSDIIKNEMMGIIESVDSSRIDYIEIVDIESLESIDIVEGKVLIALAVHIGKTRLIDNIIMEV
ncbi:MAG: pantoate--beta-alanine ligase [Clostridiales bacterium]|nr:pantoate--beta-alanine ligase [Clostridiales bacterium]